MLSCTWQREGRKSSSRPVVEGGGPRSQAAVEKIAMDVVAELRELR